MKKVLVLANYFYPDKVAFVPLITELCEALQDEFILTVIAGQEDGVFQKERLVISNHEKIKIIRVRTTEVDKANKVSRIKYIFSYFFNSIYAIIKEKDIDLIYAVSQPPILGGILGVIGKILKRKKLIYNIQDFNPEAVEAIGYSNNKKILFIAKFFDNLTCYFSDLVVVVGRDMKEKFYERYSFKKNPRVEVVNNWANGKELYHLDFENENVQKFRKNNEFIGKLTIMYSGNIGLFYDLEGIVRVFEKFKTRADILLVFIGEGAIKKELEVFAIEKNINNIKFLPYQKKEDLIYSLNSPDIHLVTNAKGIKGISVPSKIYGVMSVGKPILGVLEVGSEARVLIEESGSGYCCEPGQYDLLEKMIEKIILEKSQLQEKGLRGREFSEKYYGKDNSIKKYKILFKSLIDK